MTELILKELKISFVIRLWRILPHHNLQY